MHAQEALLHSAGIQLDSSHTVGLGGEVEGVCSSWHQCSIGADVSEAASAQQVSSYAH